MTRNKVAAKYVNLVDRVREVRQPVKPPYTVIQKVGQDIDLVVTPWFGGAMSEFDDRTLGNLVARGLQGE